MDNIGFVHVPPLIAPVARKEKKKQAKDELDRLKQAEKKKRRLEKALATSAAIRSELEKKKQKKKEEQQRLDEEGAAIAEAVALHVLLGEDSDEPCHVVLNKKEGFDVWESGNIGLESLAGARSIGLESLAGARNIGLFRGEWWRSFPYQNCTKYCVEGIGWVSNSHGSECKWNDLGQSWSPRTIEKNLCLGKGRLLGFGGRPTFPNAHMENQAPFLEQRGFGAELIAAQALSSLQIAEKVPSDGFTGAGAAAILIDGMLEDRHLENKVNLCKEF